MNTLHVITSSNISHQQIVELFEAAGRQRDVVVKRMVVGKTDYGQLANLHAHDMLYRASTLTSANILFKACVAQTGVKMLYRDKHAAIYAGENVVYNTLLHQAYGLPVIKTIFDRTRCEELLQKYVHELGGFPIIVKSIGECHGRGVRKVENMRELLVAIAELHRSDIPYILRAFVQHKKCARLIVLGNTVVSSIAYMKPADDFRTNAGELVAHEEKFSPNIEATAIAAVAALGAEYGGVDILIGDEGDYYLAEVNTPCFFPRAQMITGTDIAGAIIDHMLAK